MLDVLKSNKLLLIIMGFLFAVIVAGLLAFLALQSDSSSKPATPQVATKPEQAAPVATPVAQVEETTQTDDFAALVDESLLEQPIETDTALLKDELVQLDDIKTQLNEQKDMLEQQNQDADKLIELKEQQLLALEKQLALSQNQ